MSGEIPMNEKDLEIEGEDGEGTTEISDASVSLEHTPDSGGGETSPTPAMTGEETSMPGQGGMEQKAKPQAPAPRVESKPAPAPANSGEGVVKAAGELGKAMKDEFDVIGLSTNK